MIINMKKFLFLGAKEALADFFVRAQEEGIVEFLSEKTKTKKDHPEHVREIADAIKILRKQPKKQPYLKGETLEQAHVVARQITELKAESEKLGEEIRFTESEISRVAPFGKFSFDDIRFIERNGKKKVQFYCVKTSKAHAVEPDAPLFYMGTEYDLDYYIGIHDRHTNYPGMIEMQVEKTADDFRHHLSFLEEALHQVEAELKGFAGHIDFLREALLSELDTYHLTKAKAEVAYPIEGQIFAIEGWVPEKSIDKLPKLIAGKALSFEPITIEKGDKVPTCMDNEDSARIGEDLVRIYDIPAATDKDPSPWVLWAFTLFFSLIIADGGYGLVFLALAFFLKFKFPHFKAMGKRFVKLLFILSTGCIVWGILTTSFFGINFSPSGSIGKYSALTYIAEKKADYHRAKQDDVYKEWEKKYPQLSYASSGKQALNEAVQVKKGRKSYVMLDQFSNSILIEISLLIGVIHISLALLRYLRRNWANIGWVAFAIGGYLYFPVTLKATSLLEFLGWIPKDTAAAIGIQLLYAGIGTAFVLALIQRGIRGIAEVTNLVTVFADILSYLRLYALALASSILAQSFNEMGMAFGFVAGAVIILIGHLINISLGTMGGVIHGLRLNFIEWYHYCFEGEGRLFNPLRKLKVKWKEE